MITQHAFITPAQNSHIQYSITFLGQGVYVRKENSKFSDKAFSFIKQTKIITSLYKKLNLLHKEKVSLKKPTTSLFLYIYMYLNLFGMFKYMYR